MTGKAPLIGTRIRLDRLGDFETDAADILAFVSRNKAHLEPWSPPQAENYYTEDYWQNTATRSIESEAKGEGVYFILRDCKATRGGEVNGTITLSQIARGAFQACYLGYNLDQDRQGNGLMQEALKLAIRYAFDELQLHRIMANYRTENQRSAKTLEALGFVTEGLAKNYLYIDGAWRDHVLTSLSNPRAKPEAR